jgi:hypothetical protein
VIFDEAQELRRAETKPGELTAKYQAAAMVADQADFRMGLTATPVYNYGAEIHNILSVLAPDVLGTREEFAREWAGGAWSDKLRIQDPRALGTYLRSEGLMLRRTRKEVGRELPEVVRIPHPVDADEEALEQVTESAIALAEVIVAKEAKPVDQMQAARSFDMELRRATGVAKAPYVAALVRMLLESEPKVVLFGWHRAVYRIWQEKLEGFNPVMYTGSESDVQKAAGVEAFLQPNELLGDDGEPAPNPAASRVLIISLRSGAGLDGLQHVCNVGVFGELDWSPGIHDQCEGRYHRDGQGESCVSYFPLSDAGTDPLMSEVLNVKRMQSEPLRDPDAALFETTTDGSSRIRRLAEDFLSKHQRQVRIAA